ncbi:MAG: outer membrane beta-barrel protein [Ignavibacteria bacterium]|nr:outer membrane beta-barrel protein [Ignavibacteria bacterium]
MKNSTIKFALGFMLGTLLVLTFGTMQAQENKFRNSSWRYGMNLAGQLNAAGLGWQQLHGTDANFHSPENNIDYVDGTGGGLYIGLFGEYLSTSWWGVQLRASYDPKNTLVIDDTRFPLPSFDTKVSYLTIEPLLRIDQHAIPNLNFAIGPIIGVNLGASYIYNSDYNNTTQDPSAFTEPEADVKDFNGLTYGWQAGIAYDIKAATINDRTTMLLSPFFDCAWLVNQKQSVNEPEQGSVSDVWSTFSYRLGVRLSFDYSSVATVADATATPEPSKRVEIILPPENTILTKNIKGYFPIHPYVFFEKGSTEIPARYTMLSRADAQNFKESDLENFMKGDLTVKETNVNQLMKSYYNVMNIYADRMRENPSEKLTLRGSDPDEKSGESYALKVKNYLVTTFGIDADRISIVTASPKKPSGTAYSDPAFAGLIDDENRRVVFEFSNPDMLKSLTYTIRDESSIDNDMIFTIGKDVKFDSWDMTITGEGRSLYFGPFGYNSERINPAELMRFLESGSYNAKIMITEKSGKMSEENIAFKLNKSKELKNASRYLMLFDYDKSDAIAKYENKIRSEITPGLVAGNRVIVHGHTDVIGNPAGNQALSQERSNQAKSIIDDQLAKEGKVVDVRSIAIGQSQNQYSFTNRYPEGRMYNRNVFVEVIQ